MASRILVAALLATDVLGAALPNGHEVAVAHGAIRTLNNRSPQTEAPAEDEFSWADYANQEEFWEEWGTEQAFFEQHASLFASEDDFWAQLEANIPSQGGEGDTFRFDNYANQDEFWAEWGTEEAFPQEHANLFASEDDFWQKLEAALPSGEADAGEGAGETAPAPDPEIPAVPDDDIGSDQE